jgi:fucose 4-O-acetylase-like acetyltransferase
MMPIKKGKRIEFIDSLKGFAIFLVLWGHSIQYLKNGADYFDNPVFEFIYSFHMPLFFMISGFFFKSSLKLNFRDFICKKFIQLLLPCFIWALIFVVIDMSVSIVREVDFNWTDALKRIINPFRWPFWFLRELFISYVITYIAYKLLKKEWLVVLLTALFVLIMPYGYMQRFLLPMFLIGIFIKDKYQLISQHLNKISLVSACLFGICLLFWDSNYTVYITDFPSLFNILKTRFSISILSIALFRLLTGFLGSMFFFALFQKVYRKNCFFSQVEKVGVQTLSIYIVQTTLLEIIINRILDFPTANIWIYSLIITPVIALLALVVCMGIIYVVSKNKYAKFLLFGSSFKRKDKA